MVNYFLEIGADPNHQTLRPERDAPLHYAAARGMTEIVQVRASPSITVYFLLPFRLSARRP